MMRPPASSAKLSAWIRRRHLCSSAPAASPGVDRLNKTLEAYPLSSFTVHIGSSLATFGVAYQVLHALSFDAPALAVAGVVSKLTKRLRTPMDLSIAAAVAHSFPWANTLKLGPLLAAPMQAPASSAAAAPSSSVERGFESMLLWAQGPVNKYGGPYVMVHWLTGLATMSVTTTCVHYGVDVSHALSALPFVGGLSEASLSTASGTASSVAGAMLVNTLALPGRIYLLSIYGQPVFESLGRRRDEMMREVRSQLRRDLRAQPPRVRRRLVRHGEEAAGPSTEKS